MYTYKNKHGLSRTIPQDVKKKIRIDSFFGCVVCGHAIVDYEHVIPEFIDAKIHDPSCMTLLCPNCHRLVTNGALSKELILKSMKHPKCKSSGKSVHEFYLEKDAVIKIGSNTFKNLHILRYDLMSILSIKASSDFRHPMKINAIFYNSKNEILSEIRDNTWYANTNQHDIICSGKDFIIKDDNQELLNVKRISSKIIIIQKLNMFVNGWKIFLEKDDFSIHNVRKNMTYSFANMVYEGKKDNDTVCNAFSSNKFIFAGRLDLSKQYNGKIRIVGETQGKVFLNWPD